MKLLLDTHIFLWYITNDSKLPKSFLNALRDPSNSIYLSTASVWEAVIKHSLGKLPLPSAPATLFLQQREAHGILSLSIDEECISHLATLPLIHRDPFDRILVSQAIQLDLQMVSVDPLLLAYPVSCLKPN